MPAPTPNAFGSVEGRSVELYRLESASGVAVELLTYGGIVRSVEAPAHDGTVANIALGFADLASYVERSPYFGCIVGRYANRIREGRFALNGQVYELARNNPPNALHGGPGGFHSRIWDATPREGGLALHYLSPDGEEGYPGDLAVRVDYTLNDADELRIDYVLRNESTDRATVANVTNHGYWNLAGEGAGSVLDHELELAASAYLPVDATLIPTGEPRPVDGTPFDFRTATALGARIDADDEQLRLAGGYDHNLVLDGVGLRRVARLRDPASGRVLELETTEPGVQLYTGNQLDGTLTGPTGRAYRRHDAVVFETQHFPDSPNRPEFPSTVLGPGEERRSTTVLRFGTS